MNFDQNHKACLVLENGSYFIGKALGALNKKSFGEIVFNTGLSGYQEILTDPSYAGQTIILTYPEIGNYGINAEDNQAAKTFATGLVIKNISPVSSSWRAEQDLNSFLLKHNLSGIYGLDTRALTRMIRDIGAMRSVLSTEESFSIEDLTQEVRQSSSMQGQNLTKVVSTQKPYFRKSSASKGLIAVLDLGIKENMLNLMLQEGFDLQVLPAHTTYAEIISYKPQGIFLSNGPGDPAACQDIQETVKQLIENNIAPLFGVCLGHQILSIALGAKTFKLKFGHRGSNHPVKDLESGRIFITSQNHGFAVNENTLPFDKVKITHKSLNDDTIEGIEHKSKPIFSVQFHPEACPGPHDTNYLFQKFANAVVKSI